MKIFTLFTLVVLSFWGCQDRPKNADEVLTEYVNLMFDNKMTKEKAREFFHGELLDQIDAMSEEELANYVDMSGHTKKKMEIALQNCDETKCAITYVLRYEQKSKEEQNVYDVDVKKIVELIRVGEEWKISTINNSKTFIDSKSVIEVK